MHQPMGFLITNGGPHSSADWAEATASHIVSIAEHVSGESRGAAIKLQAAIIDILEKHHHTVKHGERARLASDGGHDRLNAALDPGDHLLVDGVVTEIVAAAKGTKWELDFVKPEIAEHLHALLHQHFKTSMDIERSYHADRNPAAPQAKAFKLSRHSGGAA